MDPEIKAKYDALPSDVKKAIDSSDMPAKIQAIGRKNGLHVDQIGNLEEAVGEVMLGITHPDEFVDEIEKELNIDTDRAIAITAAVNLDIFQPIRRSLMTMHNEGEGAAGASAPAPATGQRPVAAARTMPSAPVDEAPAMPGLMEADRANILDEIENPAPTIHPISIADQTVPGPAQPKEIVTDLVAGKLSGTVTIPSQKTTAPALAPQAPAQNPVQQAAPKPQSYSADPYREPLS